MVGLMSSAMTKTMFRSAAPEIMAPQASTRAVQTAVEGYRERDIMPDGDRMPPRGQDQTHGAGRLFPGDREGQIP